MGTPNAYYISAGVAVRMNKPELALDLYDRCLSFRNMVFVVPVENGLADFASWHAMGAAWAMMGYLGRALEYLEASLERNPDYLPAALALSAVYLRAGSPRDAVTALGKYLARNPDCGVAWEQGASILERIGLKEKAAEWLEKARSAGITEEKVGKT